MSYFLHDYLKVFTPHAVPELVSADCMQRIQTTAALLHTVDGGGFECRLGVDDGHADFAVRLARRDLDTLPSLDAIPAAQREVWSRVIALSQAWRADGSIIGAGATKLWLEYDIDDGQPPAPSVFVGLGKDPAQARACARASLELLVDAPRRSAAQAWVERCFAALPASARVAFLGVLLPRAGALVNLNFVALPNDGIAPLLDAVGWPGDARDIANFAAGLGRHCDRIALSLSFGEHVVGRIGLECFVDHPTPLPIWQRALDHFVDVGLCTPRKRAATLAWAGFSAVDRSRPDDSNLAKVTALFGDHVIAAFTRRINHLKLSYTPGGKLDLKAYFDFGHVIKTRAAAVRDAETRHYVEAVRDYYDRFAGSIVETVGTTYQAGMLEIDGRDYAASNRALAGRAGIEPGMDVLDGGCGSCGPAVDIAEAIAGVTIDAITISREQAELGRQLIASRGLSGRIRVHVGDYHDLPFHAGSFDRVLFFETLGYAYALPRLLSGVFRVLRASGAVYIKDTFVREGRLSPAQQADLDAHDRRYVHRTPHMSALVEALEQAGFVIERLGALTQISTRDYDAAIARHADGEQSTAFGRHHHHEVSRALPVYFGEILARK